MTLAPASAANEEGGAGTHRSSQISTCRTKAGISARRNSRLVPKAASCPASAIALRGLLSPGVNWRAS